ncbi:MAG TPA: DUF4870 domain-containing protein [Ktedonobacterales bacterium]|nr:DUF4870 domain-containing protein [Ktedonobacterales bacterium]
MQYGTPASQPRPQRESDRVLAGIAHLSVFFAPLLLPLIIWLALQPSAPYPARQGKQAFFFHLAIAASAFALVLVLGLIGVLLLGMGVFANAPGAVAPAVVLVPLIGLVVVALGLVMVGFSVYGAIQSFQGLPFSYPFMSRL